MNYYSHDYIYYNNYDIPSDTEIYQQKFLLEIKYINYVTFIMFVSNYEERIYISTIYIYIYISCILSTKQYADR